MFHQAQRAKTRLPVPVAKLLPVGDATALLKIRLRWYAPEATVPLPAFTELPPVAWMPRPELPVTLARPKPGAAALLVPKRT